MIVEKNRWYNNNSRQAHDINRSSYVLWIIVFLIGCSCGWLGYLLLGDIFGQCRVLYISKQEVLQYEKNRVGQQNQREHSQGNRMFFGHINEALTLMQQYAKSYENNVTKVIFVGDRFVAGKNIQSISSTVYQQTIKQLQSKYHDNNSKNDAQ